MDRLGRSEYAPDYVPPPGDTLMEVLESKGMQQSDLALRTGRPHKTINRIIKGREAITPGTALQFERVLGIPASFWTNLERRYQEHRVRRAEREALQSAVSWAKLFPLSRMMEYGWIEPTKDPVGKVQILLDFFGIASPDQYDQVAARTAPALRVSRNFEVNEYALATWLRRGIIEGQGVDCQPYDRSLFQRTLREIRALTKNDPADFVPQLISRCADCGVACVFVKELPKMRASGATRWLSSDKALIQLCLRGGYADIFWFNFFHEAGHILLHGKREIFLEEIDIEGATEAEANVFAEDSLISRRQLRSFMNSGEKSAQAVQSFASEIGVHPGIVVGRLQHEEHIPHRNLNEIRISLVWAN